MSEPPATGLALPDREPLAETYLRLVEIMARLRAPGGCPWDREQDHQSLKKYLLEEAYELLEAIDAADDVSMAEELGDVLLQVVFHATLARERGAFDLPDICTLIADKLIQRHPHVFGDTEAHTAEDVLRNWERLKQTEKSRASLLDGIPQALPALLRAHRLQQKAARVGFDWERIAEVFAKVREELVELESAHGAGDVAHTAEEFGDLLFALVNVARFLKVDPETALQRTNAKFIARFHYIEQSLAAQGRTPADASLAEMDAFWEEAKGKSEIRNQKSEKAHEA